MRRKRNKGFGFLPAALIFILINVTGVFAHTAEILPTGENKYKSVRLTSPVYNSSNPALSDMLILNSKGEAVPYFVLSGLQKTDSNLESYALELIDSYLEYDDFYFDYKLSEERSADVIATSLYFSASDTDFAKTVEVYGSHDNINWEFIQEDKLYVIDGMTKLYIDFYEPLKFTHYRLRLANNLEQVSFTDARLIYDVDTVTDNYFIEEFTPAFGVETKDRRTEIKIDGLENLRLHDVTLITEGMFMRPISAPDGSRKEIYSLTFDGASWSDASLPLNGYKPGDEPFALTIEDGDDKPLEIKSVSVRYYADDLVFESAPGETYTLEFSDRAGINPPVYDIARYQDEILREEIDGAALGEIKYAAPGLEVQDVFDYSLVFNIVVVVVALMLGAVILLMMRKRS